MCGTQVHKWVWGAGWWLDGYLKRWVLRWRLKEFNEASCLLGWNRIPYGADSEYMPFMRWKRLSSPPFWQHTLHGQGGPSRNTSNTFPLINRSHVSQNSSNNCYLFIYCTYHTLLCKWSKSKQHNTNGHGPHFRNFLRFFPKKKSCPNSRWSS